MPTQEQHSWLQSAFGVVGDLAQFAEDAVSGVMQSAESAVSSAAQPAATSGSGGGVTGSAGSTIKIEFNAFIPGSLGKAFNSFDHPTDLKNQAAFEAKLAGVSGTWLPEPGSFADNNTGPWLFETDNRGFGGGSRRVGSAGRVSSADIGSMKSKGAFFAHSTSGSTHARWKHTGLITSKGETGTVEAPARKSAKVKSSEEHVDTSASESVVTITGAGSYPFSTFAPDIDYKLVLKFTRDPTGKTVVSGEITTNTFPFYEMMINGSPVWTFSSSDTGPTLVNLNTSATSKLAPLTL